MSESISPESHTPSPGKCKSNKNCRGCKSKGGQEKRHPKVSEQPPNLELWIKTDYVGLYDHLPDNITSDHQALQAMQTHPYPWPTPSNGLMGLLSGTLNNFLLFSGQKQTYWLIDIAHNICDPAMKCGSLKI